MIFASRAPVREIVQRLILNLTRTPDSVEESTVDIRSLSSSRANSIAKEKTIGEILDSRRRDSACDHGAHLSPRHRTIAREGNLRSSHHQSRTRENTRYSDAIDSKNVINDSFNAEEVITYDNYKQENKKVLNFKCL